MGTSFVLKDEQGKICGYLMQDERLIRCRVNLPGTEEKVLHLLYPDGSEREYSLCTCGEEEMLEAQRADLCAVAVCVQGCRLCSAGNMQHWKPSAFPNHDISYAISPAIPKEKTERPAVQEHSSEDISRKQKDRKERRHDIWHEAFQGRWPPPPCIPGAVYVQGKWTETQSTEERMPEIRNDEEE